LDWRHWTGVLFQRRVLVLAFVSVFTWHAIDARGAEKEVTWHDYCREYVFSALFHRDPPAKIDKDKADHYQK
jgi:hypothetical protein